MMPGDPDSRSSTGAEHQAPPLWLSLDILHEAGDWSAIGDRDALIAEARKKLAHKRVDWVVANEAADAFGRDDNRAVWVGADDALPFGLLDKRTLADRILDQVAQALS